MGTQSELALFKRSIANFEILHRLVERNDFSCEIATKDWPHGYTFADGDSKREPKPFNRKTKATKIAFGLGYFRLMNTNKNFVFF